MLLTVSTGLLINILRKQTALQSQNDKSMWGREILTLVTIMVIFDLSYVLRFFFDLFVKPGSKEYFEFVLILALSAIFFDIIPIGLILMFHMFNFKKENRQEDEVDEGNPDQVFCDLISISHKSSMIKFDIA